MYLASAFLALLAVLAYREISKLRHVRPGWEFDPPPRYQTFSFPFQSVNALTFSVYLWRPLRFGKGHGISEPCAPYVSLKLLLA